MRHLLYRIKWHLLPKLKITSKLPIHLDIESTNACNLKCKMCMRNFLTEDIGRMDLDTYSKIFDNYTPTSIKLNWRGEPLLNKQLPLFVQFAKGRGVHEVSLNTNGLLITKDLIRHLSEAGLDWIIFSVDGATKETYEEIRQGGDFNKLLQNIRLTYHYFTGKVRIQICKQPANEYELLKWRAKFEPYADKLRIGKLHDPQGKHGYKIEIPKSCTSFWQRLAIGWNGDIYPCCSDYQGKWKLGNINNTTIYDAWHSNRMSYFRYQLSQHGRSAVPPCRNCSSYC